jgi:hypothetical protein
MAEGGITETIGKVADALKKLGLTTLAFAVAVLAAGMLWLPDAALARLKLLPFRNAHDQWIAPAFWLSALVCCFSALMKLNRPLKHKFAGRQVRKHFLRRLVHLTPGEKGALREFISERSRTKVLPAEHPIVVALSSADLIWRDSQLCHPELNRESGGLTYPMVYQINETVWHLLHERPSLLN